MPPPARSSRTDRALRRVGQVLLGGAILDEAGDMVGSVVLADFPTREELDEWLAGDPYVTGGVWQEIEVRPYRPAVGAWFPGD